jgi:hypothetical protein
MLVVRGYTHHDGSIGVLAMFKVGTDFTSRTAEFKTFADGVTMSLAFWVRDVQVPPGGEPISLNDAESAMTAPWVGEGDFENLRAAFAAASKQFREPIELVTIRNLQASP